MWWILNCLRDLGLYVSPLYYPTTERLTIAESSLWLDSVQTCYFKSVHWSLPLSYRSQSTQHEISDIEICCSYAMRAHTALRNIYSTGCLLSSPRNSPTQRCLFPVCNASRACIISEKRLRFRKTFLINKSQRVTCGSIFREQRWAATLLEENRSVVTLMNWNATKFWNGKPAQLSHSRHCTIQRAEPREERITRISSAFPPKSHPPPAAGTADFSAGNQAYSAPIVIARLPHVIKGETQHKCSHSTRTWKEKNDGDVEGIGGRRMRRHRWLNLWTVEWERAGQGMSGIVGKRMRQGEDNRHPAKQLEWTEHDNITSDHPGVEDMSWNSTENLGQKRDNCSNGTSYFKEKVTALGI